MQREVLIAFDLLLVVVVGLVLYAVSAREPGAAPTAFDRLQLLLVVSALLVDALALAAIAARITEFGFTPNRVAALGENLILLVNLARRALFRLPFPGLRTCRAGTLGRPRQPRPTRASTLSASTSCLRHGSIAGSGRETLHLYRDRR